MIDKEIKSLSKIQMLELLHQQEEEIAQLRGDGGKPAMASDSTLLNEILQSAQNAADNYLRNIQNQENEKIDGIAKLENDARSRYEEAERYSREVNARVREAINEMNNMFIGLKELVESMHEDFRQKINAAAPKSFQ